MYVHLVYTEASCCIIHSGMYLVAFRETDFRNPSPHPPRYSSSHACLVNRAQLPEREMRETDHRRGQ